MDKKDFRLKLLFLNSSILELLDDDCLYYRSALYAFLKSAHGSILNSLEHCEEYNTYIDE